MNAAESDSWALRACRAEEVEAVLGFWVQAGASPTLTDTPEDLRRVLADSRACLLVAEADRRLVGTLLGTYDGWRGHLYRMAVHPDHRRRGIARALVAAMEPHLRRQGARRIIALVELDHPGALAFWQAVGYVRDPRMVRYLRNF